MKQVDVLYFYVPKSLIFNGLPLKTFKTDLELYELGYRLLFRPNLISLFLLDLLSQVIISKVSISSKIMD